MEDLELRVGLVDAGLQWSWSTLVQIDRVRRHEATMVGRLVEPVEVTHESRRASLLGLRGDAQFCFVAASNLLATTQLLAPRGAELPDHVVRAVRTIRDGLPDRPDPPTRRRRRMSPTPDPTPEVIDLRDDPLRWSLEPAGTRIGGLGLDELGAAAQVLLSFFAELERNGFSWAGWADAPV